MSLFYKLRMIRFVLIPLLSLALLLAPMAPYSVLSLFTGVDTAEAAAALKEKPKKKFPERPTKGQKVEIPEWRTAKSKHFLKDDGYFEVEVSKNSMFYQDKGTKKWLDIDSSLVASGKNGYGYKNKANRFETQFASGAGNGSVMLLNLENASLEMLPVGIGKGAGAVKDNKITYTNAFKHTDLVYTVDSDVVKEELVLKKADAPATYTFELRLNNLKYAAKEDGSIEFQYADTSKFAFEFPKPFMFESGDLPQSDDVKEHSDKVTQTIRQEGSKLLLELKADEAWLQAPEREFPVVIDPTADMTMIDETRISDTFASRTSPTTVYNSASHMYVGNSTSYGESQSYILFPLPGLPDGARVVDAKMKLYNYLTKTTTTNVDVYEVTSSWWPASVVTWNTRPAIGQKVTSKSVAAAGWAEFNITSSAKKWYEGKLENWGLQLTAGTAEDVGFTSNDNTSAAYRPVLTMEYWVDPEGINSFWEYNEDGVNPFKGNFYLNVMDIGTSGRGVDVMVNRNYNSRQTTQKGVFGPNWLSVLDMRVWELFGSVAFLDGTGTKHIFNRIEYPNDSYSPPPGVSLALKRGTEFWEITTPDQTVYFFDRTHKIIRKVTDSNLQTTTFTYNTNDPNWTSLTMKDASGRNTTVQRVNGKVSTVTDPSSRVLTYGYDSAQGGALTSVTLKDGSGSQSLTTRYTYDQGQADTTNRRLKTITDPNGNVTAYTYDIYDRVTEVSRKINGVDVVKKYTYNTSISPREVIVKYKLCGDTNNDPNACAETRYYVNDNGNMTQKDVVISGSEIARTVYTWSTNNWLVEMRAPNHMKVNESEQHTTQIQYTDSGEPQKMTTPDGNSTLLNYDTNNNLITVKDPMEKVNGMTYDQKNNPRDITDGVGNTVMRDYDSNGNLIAVSSPMSLAENFVSNSGFEDDRVSDSVPLGWTHPVLEAGEVFEVDGSTKLGGYKSLHVKAAGTDGAYGYMKRVIPVHSKMTYSISGGLKAGANSSVELKVTFKSGSEILSQQGGLLYTQAAEQAGEWMEKSTLIEAPSGATSAVLEVAVNGTGDGPGEAWVDQLIFEGGTGRTGNILNANYSFDHDFDKTTLADGWYPYNRLNPVGISIYYDDKIHGIASGKIDGDPAGDRYVEQNLIMPGAKGTKFNLSGWSKQSGASLSGIYEMQLLFYKDEFTAPVKESIAFDKSQTGWQQKSKVVSAPIDYKFVSVKLLFGKMPTTSYALFDDVKVSKLNSISSTISQYNFIGNTSFEFDDDRTGRADGWYVYLPPEKEVQRADYEKLVRTVGLPQSDVYTGEKALEITARADDQVVVKLSDEDIPMNGKLFTLVGYLKTENLKSAAATIFVEGYDSANNRIGVVETDVLTGTNVWKRVNLLLSPEVFGGGVTSAPDAAKIKVSLKVTSGSGMAYFDNVRLQEGKFVTEFNYTGGNYPWNYVDPLGVRTDFDIDQNTGNVKSVLNGMGSKFLYDYDLTGNITQYTYPFQGAAENGSTDKTFTYGYDANGNLRTITDPNGHVPLAFSYNELNQIKSYKEKVTLEGVTSYNTWSYASDQVGRLSLVQTPEERYNDLDFDMAGRVKKLTVGTYLSGMPVEYEFGYDLNGNVTSYGEAGAKTSLTYDNMNRVKKLAEPIAGNYSENTYDDAGHRTKALVHRDDGAQWTTEYLYDSSGKPKGLKDGANQAWFLQDESGNRTKTFYSNNTSAYYKRNPGGQLTQTYMEYDGELLYKAIYEYDKVGNVVKAVAAKPGLPSAVTEFKYDASGQLLKENYGEQSIEYRYDELGNRTQKIIGEEVTDYVYNPEKNRLIAAGDKTYRYDKDGNVISDGEYEYRWNAINKLSTVKNLWSGLTTYISYDAVGHRTKLYNDNVSKEYHYDGSRVSYFIETDAEDTRTYRFAYDQAGTPVFMTLEGKQYWYHYDRAGNVIFMTDAAGKKVAAYDYDAWGNFTIELDQNSIASKNPYRYNGYWYDVEFGTYDLGARVYDAYIGRFLTKDPVTVRVGGVHSLNSYVYAANNPVTFDDPNGMTPRFTVAGEDDWEAVWDYMSYKRDSAVDFSFAATSSTLNYYEKTNTRYIDPPEPDPYNWNRVKRAPSPHRYVVTPSYSGTGKALGFFGYAFGTIDLIDTAIDTKLTVGQKVAKSGIIAGGFLVGWGAGTAVGSTIAMLGIGMFLGPVGILLVAGIAGAVAAYAYDEHVKGRLYDRYNLRGDSQ